MQGLGAFEVLRRVVRVQEEPRDHLGFKERYSPHGLSFKERYFSHGLSPQVTYRLRDKMAHAIAAQNMIVSINLPKQIEPVLTCRASCRQ